MKSLNVLVEQLHSGWYVIKKLCDPNVEAMKMLFSEIITTVQLQRFETRADENAIIWFRKMNHMTERLTFEDSTPRRLTPFSSDAKTLHHFHFFPRFID